MGDYTGLRAKVTVKPELREYIKELLHHSYDWEDAMVSFQILGDWETNPAYKMIDAPLKSWIKYPRHSFIPFGMHSYMPEEWGDAYRKFDVETGVWEFSCSVKNYDKTIEYFLENLFPLLVESCEYCEKRFEGYSSPSTFYKLVPGGEKFVVDRVITPVESQLVGK